jgi:hypothetical protein
MRTWMVFIGSTFGSMIGWFIGRPFGIFTAYISCILFTALGVWYGARIARRF